MSEEVTSQENTEERSLDELLLLSYSEMTEEEIERVIEYKSDIKARDTAYQELMDQMSELRQTQIAKLDEIANASREEFYTYADAAYARLSAAQEIRSNLLNASGDANE